MSENSPFLHIDTDYVTKILKMTHEEQQEWLTIILDYIKENDLEEDFFAAALNILSESTIEDVKNWYYSKNNL